MDDLRSPAPAGISFDDLGGRFDRQCRWPINDPRPGEQQRFCGCRSDGGSPYCAEHRQRAVRPDHAGTGTTYPGWGRKPSFSRETRRTRG